MNKLFVTFWYGLLYFIIACLIIVACAVKPNAPTLAYVLFVVALVMLVGTTTSLDKYIIHVKGYTDKVSFIFSWLTIVITIACVVTLSAVTIVGLVH